MSKIAILGYGIVGSGTVEVFYKGKTALEKKAGQKLDIKYILDIRDFPESPYKGKFVKDFNVILNDPEVTVVAELIGGLKPAYDFVNAALLAKKSVVTSNKELVACKGAELLKTAKENNVNFFFEASVGGGIPIIHPLHQCLAANEINAIAGILNGTTNFILTKMINDGTSFESALKTAQELGYAESNPSADVDGHDTCRKTCILAAISFGKHVYPESIYTEGITKITAEDGEYAESYGASVKLIGWAAKSHNDNGKINAMVCPAFIKYDSQLAGVSDVFNAILVRADMTGDVLFYGKGAGKLPTASAVVADIIDAVKLTETSQTLTWKDSPENIVNIADNNDDYRFENYLRITSLNNDLQKTVEKILGEVTYLTRKAQPKNEIAFVTSALGEKQMNIFIKELEDEGINILGRVRILDF